MAFRGLPAIIFDGMHGNVTGIERGGELAKRELLPRTVRSFE